MVDGTGTLKSGVATLADGTKSLYDGTVTLADGTKTLADGAKELYDGMETFKKDGIDKVINLYEDNVPELINRLKALEDLAKNAGSFSGATSTTECSTKFIFKGQEIKVKDDTSSDDTASSETTEDVSSESSAD